MLRVYEIDGTRLKPRDISLPHCSPHLVAEKIPWVDLLNPTMAEDRFVEAFLNVSIPTNEEMQEIEASSRVYQENDARFMTITALSEIDSDEPVLSPMTFVITGKNLVTVRYAEPRPIATFALRAAKSDAVPSTTGEHIMLGILETLIDRIADTLERIGANIESVSRNVFQDRSSSRASPQSRQKVLQTTIISLGRSGELLSKVRDSLMSISRVLTYYSSSLDDDRKTMRESRTRTRTVLRDVSSLIQHSSFLSDKITFLLDALLGMINLEQSQIIKIFSIAAVCLMPPTLIASVYGMNFKHMPELEWQLGYPLAVGAMIVSAILPFVYFRQKGWL